MADDVPKYRIRAVAEKTGIAAATLRAWERRYGIPEPARSTGRYRLYSDRDVDLVRRVARLCASGLRPAEAVKSAREATRPPPNAAAAADLALSAAQLVDVMVRAIATLDLDGLRAALDLAFSSGSAASAYDAVIAPALRRVGELWAKGELSIANEHAASQAIRERLSSLLRLVTPPAPAPRALLACFDEEQHDIGLLGFGLHVASWGFRPLYLGARVPPSALEHAIAQHAPAFVAISVVVPPEDANAPAIVSEIARACRAVPWLVGGPGAAVIAVLVRRYKGYMAPETHEQARALVVEMGGRAVAPGTKAPG